MMTIRKIIMAITLVCCCSVSASAQNCIDRVVEKLSLIGDSQFTSVVERDPKTRNIVKVVKILNIDGSGAAPIVRAFEAEKSKGKHEDTRNGDRRTLIISQCTDTQSRIYRLECGVRTFKYDNVKVTIVIKRKN